MSTPQIAIRRHPRYAFFLLVVGFAGAVVGLLVSEFWVVFMGVMPVIFAALMMLNPFVVVTDTVVELRNVFGLVRASYSHDGMHLLQVQGDTLFIQRGDLHAAIHRIDRTRLHPGDWQILLSALAAAHRAQPQKGKTNGRS